MDPGSLAIRFQTWFGVMPPERVRGELSRDRRGVPPVRQHQDDRADGPLTRRVRRTVHQASRLEPHRRAAAAVEVHRADGAQRYHLPSEPDHRHADGPFRLPPVDGDHEDRSGGRHADPGPRVPVAEVAVALRGHDLAARDQEWLAADEARHVGPSDRPRDRHVLPGLQVLDDGRARRAGPAGCQHRSSVQRHRGALARDGIHGVVANDAGLPGRPVRVAGRKEPREAPGVRHGRDVPAGRRVAVDVVAGRRAGVPAGDAEGLCGLLHARGDRRRGAVRVGMLFVL